MTKCMQTLAFWFSCQEEDFIQVVRKERIETGPKLYFSVKMTSCVLSAKAGGGGSVTGQSLKWGSAGF